MLIVGSVIVFAVATAAAAEAQLRRDSAPGFTLPTSLAAPDDALAVDWNPAALGLLPTWSAVYTGSAGVQDAGGSADSHAAYVAVPLLFGLSAGAGASSFEVPAPGGRAPRAGGAALALGWAPSRALGIGATLRWLSGRDAGLTGVATVDVAATWRPSPTLALSVVLRDVNGPERSDAALNALARSVVLAAAIRPFAAAGLSLDASAALDDRGRLAARGAVAVGIPYLGQVLAALEGNALGTDAQAVSMAAALRVQWDSLSVVGGVAVPVDAARAPGALWSARIEGGSRPGLPRGRHVREVTLRGLDERSVIETTVRLEQALHDERVAAVLLRLDGSNLGLAWSQELRVLVAALEAAGKPVVCHLEAATGAELYACAGASRVLVDPGGGVRLVGPSSTVILLGDALRSAGVRADFVRIGPYKSAAEQLLNRRASAPARLERDDLYGDVYRRFVTDLGRDLGIEALRAAALVDDGPYLAEEAVRAGLVSATADAAELDSILRELVGASLPRVRGSTSDVRLSWGNPGRVGVVVVDGDIVDGRNVDIPFIGIRMSGGDSVVEAIDALARDPSVRAIVLRVDSPGGSSMASDQIWRAVRRARRRKPVVASMGAVAASGGYYVAAAAQEIWADPATITGSIGIYYGKVDFAPLAERLGVGLEMFGRGRRSGAESVFRPFTPDERALLAQKVRVLYRQFLARVADGRGMDVAAVDAIARGRVYSGDAALRLGLVDRLGGVASAVARARELAHLPVDAEVVLVPRRPATLADYVLGGLAPASNSGGGAAVHLNPRAIPAENGASIELERLGGLAIPAELLGVLRAAIAVGLASDGAAQARLPYEVILR
jgi:protease-4